MAESFAKRWSRKESQLGLDDIASTMINCGDDSLPDSAAPCVTFEQADSPRQICDVFKNTWSSAERDRLAPFKMIGSDGAGNPFCIDDKTQRVVLLDHEDRFQTQQFVNSSVRQLGECLLTYMGEKDPERFRLAVRNIDRTAIEEGSFWWHEANCIE